MQKSEKNKKDFVYKLKYFTQILIKHKDKLPLTDPEADIPWEDITWAYFNCTSRSFGTHHLPATIAMGPFLDLMNHAPNYDKNKYFVHPFKVHRQMIARSCMAGEIEEQQQMRKTAPSGGYEL